MKFRILASDASERPIKDKGVTPCPFCGSRKTYWFMDINYQWYFHCVSCAEPGSEFSKKNIEAWNKIFKEIEAKKSRRRG